MYYGPLEALRNSQQSRVIVQPADPNKLVAALQEAGFTEIQPTPDNRIAVSNATVQQIGDVAAKAGIALYGMQEERADLEQLFFRLTSGQFAAPRRSLRPGTAGAATRLRATAPGYGPPPPDIRRSKVAIRCRPRRRVGGVRPPGRSRATRSPGRTEGTADGQADQGGVPQDPHDPAVVALLIPAVLLAFGWAWASRR